MANWYQKIIGSISGNVVEVDAANQLKVALPPTAATAGHVVMQCENDPGSITGTPYRRSPFVSEDSRMSVGIDTTLAMYNFTPTTQNTGDFKHAFTTMTMTQNGGFLNINPALATVSGNYAVLQSWRHFSLQGDGDLHVEMLGQVSATLPANQIFECGLFFATAGVAPTDGIFFRLTSAGLIGVITYNGVETTTGVLMASLPINTNSKYTIVVSQREVSFWIGGVLGAELMPPAGNAVPYLTLNLPLCFLMRNTGTVTGGATVKIGSAHATQRDLATYKPWAHQCAAQGNAYQGQEGDTMGSVAMYSNAALAAAAALTNTTAAAGNVGLGGVALVLPTLTAGTDGILFSYLNPVGSITQPPKTLVVTGVCIDSGVQTVLVGGPLNLVVGIAYGHTALSLATTETGSFVTATAKAPRRIPLGVMNYLAAAAAGSTAVEVYRQFESPIVVNPGEYFQITCRNVGTVTTTGALVMSATVDHYFE